MVTMEPMTTEYTHGTVSYYCLTAIRMDTCRRSQALAFRQQKLKMSYAECDNHPEHTMGGAKRSKDS